MKKICSKCKIEKSNDRFSKLSKSQDNLDSICKNCKKIIRKLSYIKSKLKEIKYAKQWNSNNKLKVKENRKKIYLKNKDKENKKSKQYWIKNKKILLQKENEKFNTNIDFRLKKVLRNRLRDALKNNRKYGSAVGSLGCSIKQLKQWLEQQFQIEMSWENYGQWHIDHIIPLSKVDLKNKKQLKKVCNWFNLRPLWAQENISRGNRI